MITINGEEYTLKYNINRIGLIENATGTPLMAEFAAYKGMLSIQHLQTYLAYGLKKEGSDVFVPLKTAMQMAENLILSEGYTTACGAVLEALERDCPFFFHNA